MEKPVIRDAVRADAAVIVGIYAHHVLHGTATFYTDPPTEADWDTKLARFIDCRWPFVVAAVVGQVVGYAYAAPFRDRPAYAQTCENSIYVAPDRLSRGVGGLLLDALITEARGRGFRQMIAVIGGVEPASVALHSRKGFVEAGRLHGVGRKFGLVLDTLYMQRDLPGDGEAMPQ